MFHMIDWKINRITKKIKSMQNARVHNQPEDAVLKKEILSYYELANLYKRVKKSKRHPHADLMIIECYRAAATLNDSSAHFLLGKRFLEEAKFRKKLEDQGVLSSAANVKTTQALFEEAIAHLLAADKLGHIEAKRLRGLCYINGWGLLEDKNTGFELIVNSIEQEGSWDRVPQIFAAIGLNKPEFFAAIMQRRKGIS